MRFVLSMLLLSSLVRPASAHLRNFLETYGPYTLEKGHSEVEVWNDYREPNKGDGYFYNQTEVEYGVTDRYTLGLYGVFIESKGFSALKIENRYRLDNLPASWPFMTTLYLEIKDANGNKDNDEIEGKILLGQKIGYWDVAFNGIVEYEREIANDGSTEWEAEPGFNVGAAYNTGTRITPGLELAVAENNTRIIPGVYITLANEIRLNVGVALGMESKADDYQIKSILEFEF